ncbi:MAG: hypothetical protein ACRC8C_03150 [Mycoplasmoidaceae bacterium]
MFYIKNSKCKIFKKNKCNKKQKKKNYLSFQQKIKHLLIMYAYLTEINVIGFHKKEFKKWFQNNRIEIMNYYNDVNNDFYSTFFNNDEIKNKLELIFNYNEKLISNLVKNNTFKDDQEYNEFLKMNKEYNNFLDFLKKIQMNNFNEFFIFLNCLLLPK